MLVLIHGTFSDTPGTFGKLWTYHPSRVRRLFTFYGDRVYALDHPTLGASPIANAITLAQALPAGAHLHLVTHSRGGLVAEVLAHVCGNGGGDLSPFAGKAYAEQRAEIDALTALVTTKKIQIDRVVRVACPARGTLLASKRLDAYLSIFKWTLELAGIPVAPALVDFLGAVAQHRTDPEEIPGLAAQIPDIAAGAVAALGRPAPRRPAARGRGRPRRRLGDVVAEDAARRLVLLDRQRSRRPDALDVRRRAARRRRQLPARCRRQGLALQLFHQRSHRRGGGRMRWSRTSRKAFGPIGPLSWAGTRPPAFAAPPTPRRRRVDEAGGVPPAGHSRQQPQGRQRSHLGRVASDQRPPAPRVSRRARTSPPTARSAASTTISRRFSRRRTR